MAESGLAGYEMVAWVGAFFPAAVPRPIVDRMHRFIRTALTGPVAVEYFARTGSLSVPSTPEELGAFVRSETDKWARVVKAAAIEPE